MESQKARNGWEADGKRMLILFLSVSYPLSILFSIRFLSVSYPFPILLRSHPFYILLLSSLYPFVPTAPGPPATAPGPSATAPSVQPATAPGPLAPPFIYVRHNWFRKTMCSRRPHR